MDRPLTSNSKHLLLMDSSASTGWLAIIHEGMLCKGFIGSSFCQIMTQIFFRICQENEPTPSEYSHYFTISLCQCLCHISLCRSVLSQPTSYRPRLLLEGRPGSGQSSHLAPAALHALEKFTVYTLDMAVLFGASTTAPEETCAQVNKIPLCRIKWL